MDLELMDWLRDQWRLSNINKYRHLFDEWVKNITPEQISGFRHNMMSDYVNHNN